MWYTICRRDEDQIVSPLCQPCLLCENQNVSTSTALIIVLRMLNSTGDATRRKLRSHTGYINFTHFNPMVLTSTQVLNNPAIYTNINSIIRFHPLP